MAARKLAAECIKLHHVPISDSHASTTAFRVMLNGNPHSESCGQIAFESERICILGLAGRTIRNTRLSLPPCKVFGVTHRHSSCQDRLCKCTRIGRSDQSTRMSGGQPAVPQVLLNLFRK